MIKKGRANFWPCWLWCGLWWSKVF